MKMYVVMASGCTFIPAYLNTSLYTCFLPQQDSSGLPAAQPHIPIRVHAKRASSVSPRPCADTRHSGSWATTKSRSWMTTCKNFTFGSRDRKRVR